MKHFFKEEKRRKKHEDKVEKDVAHEKIQREAAIDDLYAKLNDYETHKYKQLVRDGIDIDFKDKDHKIHVLTKHHGGSSSGSGGKKHKNKHGKHMDMYG